jgi:hypothetical protein
MLKWGSVEERQYQLGNKRNKILVHTNFQSLIQSPPPQKCGKRKINHQKE